jgi:hypothetical protein
MIVTSLRTSRPMTIASKHPLRRRFTENEDKTLRTLVGMFGLNKWEKIATFIPERTPRQCRDRYEYYLAPNVYNPPWTDAEDELLRKKLTQFGPKWVMLARSFPGRTGNHLKNRWYKVLLKRPSSSVQTRAVSDVSSVENDTDFTFQETCLEGEPDESLFWDWSVTP